MTIMPVEPIEALATASYESWSAAVDKLRELAAELGLECKGWVAVPANPPVIKIESDEDGDPFWTCPHCGEAQYELELVEEGDYCTLAEPNAAENNSIDRMDENFGRKLDPEHPGYLKPAWSAHSDLAETSTIGYYCLGCNGWVTPEDEVNWS